MACVPGMPCYSITNVVFPKKCNNGWLDGLGLNTDLILYNGPNLPCTGINFQDTLTCVIDKINDLLCPEALTSSVLAIIQTNPQYNEQFCELVQACLTTTTSTSTSTTTSTTTIAPTTTTSTTTATPLSYAFTLKYSAIDGPTACASGVSGTYYSDTPLIAGLSVISTDYNQLFRAADGHYCLDGCPNPSNIIYFECSTILGIGGVVSTTANC